MSIKYYSDVITSGTTEDTIHISSNDTLNDIISSTMNSTFSAGTSIGTSTVPIGTGAIYGTYHNTNAPVWISTNPTTPNTLDVKGDANFEGDIKFKGRSLQELFSKIEDRLAILQPDPAKLEKYEALRKAYDHYKMLEKLIGNE